MLVQSSHFLAGFTPCYIKCQIQLKSRPNVTTITKDFVCFLNDLQILAFNTNSNGILLQWIGNNNGIPLQLNGKAKECVGVGRANGIQMFRAFNGGGALGRLLISWMVNDSSHIFNFHKFIQILQP